jgi:hypothetical protein
MRVTDFDEMLAPHFTTRIRLTRELSVRHFTSADNPEHGFANPRFKVKDGAKIGMFRVDM